MYEDSPLLHCIFGLKGGMGRTQNQHGLLILRPQPGHVPCMVAWFLWFFERWIFFSLDPNGSDGGQWKKNSRPGPHNHTNDLSTNLTPDLSFQLVWKAAMEADWINVLLLIMDQAGNPLSPFCFANNDEDCLSTVEH